MPHSEPSALTHAPAQVAQRTIRYTEYRYFSVTLGAQATRLSMRDARGGEFFAVIPQGGNGRQNREAKYRALDCLAEAIAEGHEPGEVEITEAEASESGAAIG